MINLLPPEQKKELAVQEKKKITVILGLVILFSIICLIIILASLELYLSIQVDSQKSALESIKKQEGKSESQAVQEQVKDSNKKITRINDFYKDRVILVKVFEELIRTIPGGIYLTDLSYSKKSSQIILAGSSPSLDVFDQFHENLKNKEIFENIDFPLSNLANLANFSGVTITIKNDFFK